MKTRMTVHFRDVDRVRQIETRKSEIRAERESKTAQIETLKKEITEISKEDRRTLDEHQKYLTEEQLVKRILEGGTKITTAITSAKSTASTAMEGISVGEGTPSRELLDGMRNMLDTLMRYAVTELSKIEGTASSSVVEIYSGKAKWHERHEAHLQAYEQASQRSEKYKKQLDEIKKLSEEVQQLVMQEEQLRKERSEISAGEADEERNRKKWMELHRSRGDLLEQECKKMSGESPGDIRVTLKRGADIDKALDVLRKVLSGTRTQGSWIDQLGEHIVNANNPADEWSKLLSELRVLAEMPKESASSAPMPASPELDKAGFTETVKRRIAEYIDVEAWRELAVISLEDKPVFLFKVGDSRDIPFKSASPGQQATALLKVLLSQPGGPLIIDQPEDDLDNEIINKIIEAISLAKEKRQLIFASHNANVVVNGDAELVIPCKYLSTEKRSEGIIQKPGAIEEPDICSTIKVVMEGGEKAFSLRRVKYGF